MSRARLWKSVALAMALAALQCVFTPPSGAELNEVDFKRILVSGSPQELKAALTEISADLVFQSGNQPLHVAAEHASDPAVVSAIVKKGASLSAEGLEKLTPLMLAAAYNTNAAVTEALISAGADINLADKQGRTPLYFSAASNDSPEVTGALLRHKAIPNVRDKSGRTPLWMAANRANAQIVQLLLDAGSMVDDPNDDGMTPLLVASERPDAAVLRFLVEAGANLNVRGKNRYSPLMSAVAAGGDPAAVQVLLDGKADVKAENDQNRSAIHLLAARNDAAPEVLTALTNAGANPNAMDSSLTTPLMEVCKQKNSAAAAALLKAGASVSMRDRNSWTAMLHAASKGASFEMYDLLKKAGSDVNDRTRQGTSALMIALESKVASGDLEALLKAGANPNYAGYDTISVLMGAIAAEDAEAAEVLLRYGADPNQSTWDGLYPLMLAAQRVENAAMFEVLAAKGADVNAQSAQGVTALMVAATSGNVPALESLIALSADLEIKDLDGFTPIFHSTQANEEDDGALDIMDLLIAAGSDVNVRDTTGATPLMHVAMSAKYDMAERLIAAGANTEATDFVGWTPLHFAARSDEGDDVAELIIEKFSQKGKSVDVPDSGGTTPLMVAASYNNSGTVRLLLEAGASLSLQDNTGRNAYEYAVMKNASDARDVLKEAMEESQRVNTDRQAKRSK